MFIVYDLIFLLFSLIYLPVYYLRKKFHRDFSSRLGKLPQGLDLGRPIWIHAVSVGEAMAVRGLVEELRKIYPFKKFVISTVTPTGNKIAKTIARNGDFVTYLPLDFSFIVRKVIDKINPEIFIIAETEIWPNLIRCLWKKEIPIITVNGRISDASFKGYSSIKFLLKPVLEKVKLFCVQTGRDRQRLKYLGVPEERIEVTGNMKFDSAGISCKPNPILALRQDEKLLVAGSTHSGEEEIVLGAYLELCKKTENLRLLIAPRHPERGQEVEKIIIKHGFNPVRISQLTSSSAGIAGKQAVFILDTVGQLVSFYAAADIVFVGGSLVKKGGQNILEPASLGKPVLFGPYMSNFSDIADLFLSENAAIMVHTKEELIVKAAELLNDPYAAAQLTRKSKQLILQNQGATRKNAEFISKYI